MLGNKRNASVFQNAAAPAEEAVNQQKSAAQPPDSAPTVLTQILKASRNCFPLYLSAP